MKRLPKSLDWSGLRAEFIAGSESLNQFRLRHGLARDYFYKRANGWDEARGKIRERGVKRAEVRVEDFYSSFARETRDLLKALLLHARKLLGEADRRGSILAPMELAAFARALGEGLKSANLLSDRPTESVTVGPRPGDLNQKLVDLLEAMGEGRPPTDEIGASE